jgi:hypothetical protein
MAPADTPGVPALPRGEALCGGRAERGTLGEGHEGRTTVATSLRGFFRRHGLTLAVTTWLLLVCVGMRFVLDYQTRPGVSAHPPLAWPLASRILPAEGEPRLLLFVHPHCPCSRATLSELARVVAQTRGHLHVAVEFVVPPGQESRWGQTDLWQSVSGIPGVQVGLDQNGVEARRFGSVTSGQVLLYDAMGHLQFAGGITAGRGHAGDNAGSDAVVSFIRDGSGPRSSTPVYGCALASPASPMERMPFRCPR